MFKKINKMEIITQFLKNPEKEFHLRELSRIAKKSPATILKYLKETKEAITYKKEKNLSLFKANVNSDTFKELKIEYNIKLLKESKTITYLISQLNQPEAIILFGSFGRGEDFEKSDVDLAIMTPLQKKLELSKFEKKLNRKISLHLFSKERIEKMKKNNKELLNNLINGKIINGYWELFR